MSWYNHMIKAHDDARERNRREQRRVDGERHGPQFVMQYELARLEKEKKMIEKELERIRKGIHRPPKLDEYIPRKGGNDLNIFSPRQQEFRPAAIDPEYSKDENQLYEAMLFLKNNPSALVPILTAHARSDAYLETLERISPRLISDSKQTFVPKYFKNNATALEKAELLNKYTTLLHSHSPVLQRDSPLLHTNRNSPVLISDSPPARMHQRDAEIVNVIDLNDKDVVRDHVDCGKKSATHVVDEISRLRQTLPFAKLENNGVYSAHERLSAALNNSAVELPSIERKLPTTEPLTDEQKSQVKALNPKAIGVFPDYNPEVYNADGSLRMMHQMPSFDSRWKEAEKARYIRTKDLLERDRELNVCNMFDKQ